MVATYPDLAVYAGSKDENLVDISSRIVGVRIEKIENGIDMVTLTVENENASQYLTNIKPNYVVVIKGVKNSNPPTPVNWSNVPVMFRGRIQFISPVLTETGQVLQVIVYGDGYQLKEMRVNKKYGVPNIADTVAVTWSYNNKVQQWSVEGKSPYLQDYQPRFSFVSMDRPYSYIYKNLGGSIHHTIGDFNFLIDPDFHGEELEKLRLHIVAGVYTIEGYTPSYVDITPFYSLDNGVTWKVFGPFFEVKATVNSAGEKPVWGWYPNPFSYDPLRGDTLALGEDLSINIKSAVPYWNKNLLVRLQITGASPPRRGGVSVIMMYLEYKFKATSGRTVRQLIAGDAYTDGIIENFVDKMGLSEQTGNLSSGYEPLNTDYVYGYTDIDDDFKIPFMNFPFEDALTCIQDIIKYASALRMVKNTAGLHWIVAPYNKLYLAPVNNHDVKGKSVNHTISDYWILKPYPNTPIKVKRDMITQEFKLEPPYANFVLVSGRYQYPMGNEIAKGRDLGLWMTGGGIGIGARTVKAISSDLAVGHPCLEFTGKFSIGVLVKNAYAYPLPADLQNGGLLKLMGKDATPRVILNFKAGGWTEGHKLCFFVEKNGVPDINNFFWYALTGLNEGEWKEIEINLPNLKFLRDTRGWNIETDGSLDLNDFDKVKYWGIWFDTSTLAVVPTRCWLSKFIIQGVVIRGAYDYVSIKPVEQGGYGYGCRLLTVKDSLCLTDTLNRDDVKSALSVETLYDLQRHGRVILTGEIAIPFDPIFLAGQQVWLQAEHDVENEEYKINTWFRIMKVTHEFTSEEGTGARTKLQVTTDLQSSIPLDTTSPYTVLMRSFNPDFQSKTLGSLKAAGEFDQGLEPIIFTNGKPIP